MTIDESNTPTTTTELTPSQKADEIVEKVMSAPPVSLPPSSSPSVPPQEPAPAPATVTEQQDMYGLTPTDWNDWDKAKKAMYEHFKQHLNEEVDKWLPRYGRK